jgi:hypothetical protein
MPEGVHAINGRYSNEPFFCGTDGSKPFISKHAYGYVDRTEAIQLQERREQYTLGGIGITAQKHAGIKDITHPFQYLMTSGSGDTMYAQNRSPTWSIPIGMQNAASTCLQATIEHLRSAQEDEIWNQLAPIQMIDVNRPNTFMWTTNYYESQMANQTTARGAANRIEASNFTGVGVLENYKIKGEVFLDFFETEMGTAHWYHVMISMAKALVLAGQYQAAVKIASADKIYEAKARAEDGGILPTFDQYWDFIAQHWAYFQRPHHNNVASLRTIFERRLTNQGAHPGKYEWIITKTTYACITKFDERSHTYNVAGERGLNMMDGKVASRVNLSNDPVVVVDEFTLARRSNDHPFNGPFEVAEHFEMMNEPGFGRDRFVYDGKNKTLAKITFKHAASNLIGVTYNNGQAIAIKKPDMPTIEAPENPEHSYYPWKNSMKGDMANAFGTTANDILVAINGAINNTPNVATFGILAIRPHQSYFADNSYYQKTGDTVLRLQKPGEAIAVDKAPEFLHEITVCAKLGTAVVNPQNIVKAPNTVITEYRGGEGVTPLSMDDYNPSRPDGLHSGDIVYIMVPDTWTIDKVPRNLCLHGDLSVLASEYAPEDVGEHWYPGCAFVNSITQWRQRKTGLPSGRYYDRGNRKIPFPVAACSRRMTYHLPDPLNQKPSATRPGNGFWRMDATYPLCGNAREAGSFSATPQSVTSNIMDG